MFGPGEEKEATMGASESNCVSLVWMVPTGSLKTNNMRFHYFSSTKSMQLFVRPKEKIILS